MKSLHKINSASFCVNPWYWLRINAQGEISYCARSTDYVSQSTGSFAKDFAQHSMMLDARRNLLNGKFPQGCNRCITEEKLGGAFRKKQNFIAAIHPDWFDQSLTQSPVYNRLTKHNINPHAVFVMFSNQCNLACRMCLPRTSSNLASIYNQHNYTTQFSLDTQTVGQYAQLQQPKVHSWSDDPVRWTEFLTFVTNNRDLEILQINGGEPFVQLQFHQLIDHMLHQQRQNLKIIVTTNGTIVDTVLLKKLQKFDACFIDVSIESLADTNNYIRTGSTYNTILNNLTQLIKFSTDNLKFGVHLTPQIYSVETLDTLLDFCVLHNIEVIANQVHVHQCLQISVLPPEIKKNLHQRLSKKYKNTDGMNSSIITAINNILHWLSAAEPANITDLRKLFVLHTLSHDKMLNTNFSKTYPHLIEFYKDYGYECD